jgi:hypothetical protein
MNNFICTLSGSDDSPGGRIHSYVKQEIAHRLSLSMAAIPDAKGLQDFEVILKQLLIRAVLHEK